MYLLDYDNHALERKKLDRLEKNCYHCIFAKRGKDVRLWRCSTPLPAEHPMTG